MISKYSTLTSRTDALRWANECADLTDEQAARVADWIWDAKPWPNCSYMEHPLSRITGEQFWLLAEGDVEDIDYDDYNVEDVDYYDDY